MRKNNDLTKKISNLDTKIEKLGLEKDLCFTEMMDDIDKLNKVIKRKDLQIK